MTFALEFYSLSWDVLKTALSRPKPELLQAVEQQQWPRLLEDTDLGEGEHHLLPFPHDDASPLLQTAARHIHDGFEGIAAAMGQTVPAHQDMPEIDDDAALVFAATVRQLGKPLGAIQHAASVRRDQDGELPIDFRAMFLNGVAGSCFGNHQLGENLAARPLFGLVHLDFLSWGGLTQREIDALLANFGLPDAERQDDEWRAIAGFAEGWLNQLLSALRNAQSAKSDLVTLYLTVQERYGSVWEELEDEVRGGFFHH
jgi:hypothetical protein